MNTDPQTPPKNSRNTTIAIVSFVLPLILVLLLPDCRSWSSRTDSGTSIVLSEYTWSDTIPVDNPRTFNGAIVKGYAEQLLVRDMRTRSIRQIGPHGSLDISSFTSGFQLKIAGTVRGPVLYKYWQ